MPRIPDNIEAMKLLGHDYRIGYSNLGTVRIYGESGKYSIYMGNSAQLQNDGIAHRFVRDNCEDLATVSEVIKNLSIEVRDGYKVVLCI